jgi:hypothetical protein
MVRRQTMQRYRAKLTDANRGRSATNYQEEETTRYLIRLRNRETGQLAYIGGVPVPTDHDDEQVIAMERSGLTVYDNENTLFESFEEASTFPYPTAEVAASVIRGLPETQNIDYEIVPIEWVVN